MLPGPRCWCCTHVNCWPIHMVPEHMTWAHHPTWDINFSSLILDCVPGLSPPLAKLSLKHVSLSFMYPFPLLPQYLWIKLSLSGNSFLLRKRILLRMSLKAWVRSRTNFAFLVISRLTVLDLPSYFWGDQKWKEISSNFPARGWHHFFNHFT